MVLVPTEIKKIGIMKELNGRQGPCDRGFHVPTKEEMVSLYNMGISLGAWSSTSPNGMISYLYFPLSGYRQNDSTLNVQGYSGYLLSCSPSDNESYPDYSPGWLYNSTLNINDFSVVARCNGYPIRPFKDTPVIPDSSWTVNYQGTGNAGIYYNSTDKIISISDDGENWITIADRNLGATSNNTSSNTSYGKYYQWGNNYGFSTTGTVTISTTQVDASNYGPGNYYYSSTFITRSSAPRLWDNPRNDNLRGGVNPNYLGEVPIKTVSTFKQASDMRGPCDAGFHVPLNTEWAGLQTIMNGLGLSNGPDWRINLHMPFVGYRNYSNASIINQGSGGYYWSSSPYGSGYPYNAYDLYLGSSVRTDYNDNRAYGYSVRCFKDSFELPTSSWTIITGTLGGAGIFWNQTDGLISITSNGTTGYTIKDKNLGATTVYNDGDTLTQANMGNMYQWGNNYGFPSTGSVTTSSTQVNAQNYGPGNYYNSSTFIIGNYDWSSVENLNLRGGISKGTHLGEEIIFQSAPVYQPVEDIIVSTYYSSYNQPSYYYGICFTPKVNCTLDKIKFQTSNPYGTVKICQGNLLSSTTGQVTYSKASGSGQEFTFPTPYEMTAGTNYCIGLLGYNQSYYNGNPPTIDLTNIKYRWSTSSGSSSQITGYVYCISTVTTTQTS